MRKLLMIDDDQTLGLLLKTVMVEHGFDITVADRPSKGLPMIANRPDLILLDVMLPEQDGFEVCKRIRATGDKTPIIMLTGKGGDTDRIQGLNLGADDYLPKPFNHLELVARISAVLRREERAEPLAAPPGSRLDHERRTLWIEGREFVLTVMEYKILTVLTNAPGRVFSRVELIEALDEAGASDAFDRAIDSHVSRLRAKIEADSRTPKYLHTVRGMGYRWQW